MSLFAFNHKLVILVIAVAITSVTSFSQVPYFDWAKGFDTGYSWGFDLCVDDEDNSYTVGYFDGSLTADTPNGVVTINSSVSGENCFIQKTDKDGTVLWLKSLTSDIHSIGKSITVDPNHNVYVTGSFQGSTDFDPNVTSYSLNASSTSDIFVLKLDSNGNFVWVKTMTGGNLSSIADIGNSITLDKNYNLVLIGEFSGTVDFDPNGGNADKTASGEDVFIQKLDTNGNLIWVQIVEASGGDKVTTDQSGSIFVSGSFTGTVDLDPGVLTSYYSSATSYPDAYLLKLNSNGNLLWANCVGGSMYDFGQDAKVDSAGCVYFLGRFQTSVDFNPNGSPLIYNSMGSQDIFLQKFDSLGNLIWAKTFGEVYYDYGKSLTLDSLANIYISGYFQGGVGTDGIIDLDPNSGTAYFYANGFGMSDIFVSKLDSAGSYIWGFSVGSQWTDIGECIGLDAENNVLLSGCFTSGTNPVDFDPNTGVFQLLNPDNRSSFVAKYEEGYLGLTESEEEINFSVFPNPTHDSQTITLYVAEPIRGIVLLQDVNGQHIKTIYDGRLDESNVQFHVSVSELPVGIYFYAVILEDGTVYHQKIIKN